MSNYFENNVDKNRLELILSIKLKYAHNEISLEEGRKEIREKLGTVSPLEIAAMEQELLKFETDQCRKEDIQAMTALFQDLLDSSQPQLEEGHPILHYYRENEELKKILLSIEELITKPVIKNQWYELYENLSQIKIHFSRKQNQLYSILEKKGFTRPTTTMWTLDDFIRDEIKESRDLLEKDETLFLEAQKILVDDIRDLLEKEEKILFPTSLAMISEQEFEDMKEGDLEIGFAWIHVEKSKPSVTKSDFKHGNAEFLKDLNQLLNKYDLAKNNQNFDVKTGVLSLEQINLIYQHMPVDLSFVDEHEVVKFYTDTKHRIFPRSKNVIGRDVKNCHPRNSVHIVEEIIEKFRSGEQSEAEFWINKPEVFLYIKYIAVRDEEGRFRGVLEMMQDCTHIRSLEGSQTLLQWSSQKEEAQETSDDLADKENPHEIKVDEHTKLSDLLKDFPGLKDELPKIHPAFKMLHSPLSRVLISGATIKIMSERSGMEMDDLIEKINHYMKER